MASSSVLIATPCFGGNMGERCAVSLFKTAQFFTENKIRHSLITMANESLISRGRSRLFSFFYNNTDFDYLLFLDADIGFHPQDILKLMELNRPFTCAGVPLKSLDPKYNFGVVADKNGKLVFDDARKALQVDYVGTAFMMLHRSVYSTMAKHYGHLRYMPSKTHTNRPATDQEMENSFYFFQPDVVDGDLKSEDYMFCKRWRDIGGNIWLRPDIILDHTGSHVFTGIDLTRVFK